MHVQVGIGGSSDGDSGDMGTESCQNLQVMCWNVCGWSNLDVGELGRGVHHTDIRSLVLKVLYA